MDQKIVAALRRLDISVLVAIVRILQESAAQYDPAGGATCLLCGQERARVRNTSGCIRSHKCQNCGLVFSSVEKRA